MDKETSGGDRNARWAEARQLFEKALNEYRRVRDTLEGRDDGDLVDLLRGGQGVFNIVPLANVVAELTTTIRQSQLATSEKETRSA